MTKREYELTRRNVLKKGVLATSAVVIGGTAATGTAAADIGDGRVGHYTLNNLHYNVDKGEKTQDHVHDASPEKNHGTWEGDNDDPVVDGVVGNAYEFDGSNDRISIDAFTDVSGGPVTIAAWAYPQSSPKDFSNVLSLANEFGDNRTNSVLIQHRGRETGNPFAYYASDGSGGLANIDSGSISEESWYHVALTQDGEDLRAYLNGSELPDSPVSVEDYVGVSTNVARIGQNAIGKDITFYDAKIDEVRVYNRALSSAEVTELYDMRD